LIELFKMVRGISTVPLVSYFRFAEETYSRTQFTNWQKYTVGVMRNCTSSLFKLWIIGMTCHRKLLKSQLLTPSTVTLIGYDISLYKYVQWRSHGGWIQPPPSTFLQGHSCDLHKIDEKNFAVGGGVPRVVCHVSQWTT